MTPEERDQDVDVVVAMARFGGSFVQALARAARLADDNNLARIKATWPEYWREYAELARLSARKEQS